MLRPNRALLAIGVWFAAGWTLAADAPVVWDAARFDRDIAPLLARHCLECHNPSDNEGRLDLTNRATALAGGESGAALVPGDLVTGLLWQRVEAGEMPPAGKLAADEQQTLRHWIEAGAPWGSDPIDRFRYTTDRRAGYDWWSLSPVRRPEPPAVADSAWPTNSIDCFVLSQLEQHGLAPSEPATRLVLIRRLYFDLIGLPPAPEEVARFLADPDPLAYDNLVEQLLASPHYGERWARHWLDVVRFAETNGFEYDEPRPHAWPYRDWVIDALNADMPYDEFCRQQLAGDVLYPDDTAGLAAVGFLAAGPRDTPGQNQQSAAMRAVVRQDELEDLVGTSAQAFLGLTLHCARCHDHKFDPLRQTDYFGFVAAFSGVQQGEREMSTPAQRAARENARLAARDDARRLTTEIEAIDAPARQRLLARRGVAGRPGPAPMAVATWDFDALHDTSGELSFGTQGGATLADGALRLDGRAAYAVSKPLPYALGPKTLQAWVQLADLQQQGGGAMSVETPDGQVFDAMVFGEQEAGQWSAGSNDFVRTKSFQGSPETVAAERPVRITLCYDADGTIRAYRDGEPYGAPYLSSGLNSFAAGQSRVLFGLRHSPAGGNRLLAGAIWRAQLFDHALSAEEVAAAGDEIPTSEIVRELPAAESERRTQLVEQLATARRALSPTPVPVVYTCVPREPEVTHLLQRGDTRLPAEVVAPRGIDSVAPGSDWNLAAAAPEAARRVALARWTTQRENPLFARVIVNRLWHHHFGVGLVDTPNDFGFNGSRPSHPELLDWLAAELVDNGYRLKSLHRLLVQSATYRQGSVARADAVEADRGNRLLWRRTPQRLEAEALRDAILAIAGRLQDAGDGPGFEDYLAQQRAGTWSYLPRDLSGPEVERRTIYRRTTRGGRGGLLDAFDCPDPSTTTPRRAVTTTPLQALALLNNAFVLRMSEALAERVTHDVGAAATAQVGRAFQLAYGRAPRPDEQALALRLVDQQGLATLARVLFNSNEFLHVD